MAWFVQITGSEATGCQVIVHFYVVPDVFTIIIIKIMITNMAKAIIISVTETEFWVPDHESQTAVMTKFRAFMRNPDLCRPTF